MEVIAALILSAVLVAMILPIIGSTLEGSRRSLRTLPATQGLRTQMDAIWQLSRTTYADNLPGLSNAVDQAAANNPSYSVLANDWVDFDEQGVEVPGGGSQNVLRVTLGNNAGERLTSYFFANN